MAELLTQNTLAGKLSEKYGISEDIAKKIVERFFSSIKDELKAADNVSVAGLGVFKKKWIEEADGINPSNGETITIPAHYRIKFKASAPVSQLFNKKYSKLKPKLAKEKAVAEKDEPVPEKTEKAISQENTEVSSNQPPEKKNGTAKIIAIAVIALIILAVLIILLARGCSSKKNQAYDSVPSAVDTQSAVAGEQAEQKQTEQIKHAEEPASPVVTKKVSEFTLKDYKVSYGGNYHTIALEEYGNRHLWPVIFNANKDSSPNPDVITSGAVIKVPEIKSLSEDAENIKAAMLEAYNAYKKQISASNSDYQNSEKKRLAAGVLTSAEVLYPGFIDANKDRIDPEYAQYAKGILARNYN